jgi:hypothetical protein
VGARSALIPAAASSGIEARDPRRSVTKVRNRAVLVAFPGCGATAAQLSAEERLVAHAQTQGAPRLAWLRDCGDHKGVSLVLVLVLVGAGAAIWWQVRHGQWGLVRRVVFWVVLVMVLWVLVNWYSVPHP